MGESRSINGVGAGTKHQFFDSNVSGNGGPAISTPLAVGIGVEGVLHPAHVKLRETVRRLVKAGKIREVTPSMKDTLSNWAKALASELRRELEVSGADEILTARLERYLEDLELFRKQRIGAVMNLIEARERFANEPAPGSLPRPTFEILVQTGALSLVLAWTIAELNLIPHAATNTLGSILFAFLISLGVASGAYWALPLYKLARWVESLIVFVVGAMISASLAVVRISLLNAEYWSSLALGVFEFALFVILELNALRYRGEVAAHREISDRYSSHEREKGVWELRVDELDKNISQKETEIEECRSELALIHTLKTRGSEIGDAFTASAILAAETAVAEVKAEEDTLLFR